MNKNQVIPFDGEQNFLSLRDAMNHLFDESFWSPFDRNVLPHFSSGGIKFPKVDITETEKEITVTANVPGISPEEVSLEISDGILTISGKTEKEYHEENKEKKVHCYERESGSFIRRLSLPTKEIVEDQVEAEVKNGVLTVKLPKAKKETKKKIQIKVK